MTYVLRAAKKATWSGLPEVDPERRADAMGTFARRAVDSDGISVYATKDAVEERTVVAALACQKCEDSRVDLLVLGVDEVERFGAVTPCLGQLAVAKANRLHAVLDWMPDKFEALVEFLLAERREAKRYKTGDVRSAIMQLDESDVEEGPRREFIARIKRTKAQ